MADAEETAQNRVPEYVHAAKAKQLEAEAEFLKAQAAEKAAELRKQLAYAEVAELELDQKRKAVAEIEADDAFHRVFRFRSAVADNSVAQCIGQLNTWRRIYPGEPITIIFTSPGGDVIAGLALWDYLQELRDSGTTIVTKTQGMAASMAGILLQAGDVRVMGKESYLLIHQIQAGMLGSYGELKDRMKWLEKVQDRILDIFSSRAAAATGQEQRRVRRMFEKEWLRTDWWIASDEALRLGLVDRVE